MINTLIKSTAMAVTFAISALTLQGCSSGLDPDVFSVELSEQGAYSWSTPVITIRSNTAEPIDITNVTINNVHIQDTTQDLTSHYIFRWDKSFA